MTLLDLYGILATSFLVSVFITFFEYLTTYDQKKESANSAEYLGEYYAKKPRRT